MMALAAALWTPMSMLVVMDSPSEPSNVATVLSSVASNESGSSASAEPTIRMVVAASPASRSS